MQLTADEEALALDTLHACGIEGSDATTGLATLCRLATAPTFFDWLVQHNHLTVEGPATVNAELSALYGQDAVRHANVLVHRLDPSDLASGG